MNLVNLFCDERSSILYVGASVTAQKEGFRPEFHNILQTHVGHPIPFYVNALGGVGSMFGVANIKREKEYYKNVELIILEYSTGDLNLWITPKDIFPHTLHELFEECQKICSRIVVLHNFRSDFLGSKASIIHNYYNYYSFQFKSQVIDLHETISNIVSEDPDWLAINYRDHVHTTDKGAVFVAKLLFTGLRDDKFIETSDAQNLPMESLGLKYYSISEETGADRAVFEFTYPSTGQIFEYIKIAEDCFCDFWFSGEIYGLVTIVGPLSGFMNFSTEEKNHQVTLFDRNCHYYRTHCIPLRIKSEKVTLLRMSQLALTPDFSTSKLTHKDFSEPREARICGLIGRNLRIERSGNAA